MSITQRKSRLSVAKIITKEELDEFNKKNNKSDLENKEKEKCLIF